MDWIKTYLNTFITEIPRILENNFTSIKNYFSVFYNGDKGILIKPLETTGRVKGANGEFVTAIIDNLTVRKQFTNLYENYNTADLDFVTAYNGPDASSRIATSEASTNWIWPYEPSTYSWVDVLKPYYKISNDVSVAFQSNNISQEFQLMFDTSTALTSPYTILLESSIGGQVNLNVNFSDAPTTWIKLVAVAYDSSFGPKWAVKQHGGNYSII